MKFQVVFVIFIVSVALSSAASSYYWRQGHATTQCSSALTYAEVYPLDCALDEATELWRYGACSATNVTVYQCNDPACTDCPNSDTYNFSSCGQINGGFYQSFSYVCSAVLPDTAIPYAQIETDYESSFGGCSGNWSVKVYTSLFNYCSFNTSYRCYPNGTVTDLTCTDNKCADCVEAPVDDCEALFTGGYAQYSCIGNASSTTTTTGTSTHAASTGTLTSSTSGNVTTSTSDGSRLISYSLFAIACVALASVFLF